jgi:membrane dipeptidase
MDTDLDRAEPLDSDSWARRLSVPKEAVDLYRSADVLDLHLDTFIWSRIFGYDLLKRHDRAPLGRHFFFHTDFPRALEAGLTGGVWVITTNPFRPSSNREQVFLKNLDRMKRTIGDAGSRLAFVRTAAEYRAARAKGLHGAFIGIQGGNALDADADALSVLVDRSIVRVTLVHLTGSSLGATSAPSSGNDAITDAGRDAVRKLESMRVLVDLAHIGRRTFFQAIEAHDRSLPLIVTHTGVDAVHPHWRNLTDDQIRAIADSGGTVGIMLQSGFLGRGRVDVRTFVDHVAHVIDLVGEDHVSLGSDFDGMISPPRDLPTPFAYPRVVAELLRRGYGDVCVRKFLATNALRTIEAMRG